MPFYHRNNNCVLQPRKSLWVVWLPCWCQTVWLMWCLCHFWTIWTLLVGLRKSEGATDTISTSLPKCRDKEKIRAVICEIPGGHGWISLGKSTFSLSHLSYKMIDIVMYRSFSSSFLLHISTTYPVVQWDFQNKGWMVFQTQGYIGIANSLPLLKYTISH